MAVKELLDSTDSEVQTNLALFGLNVAMKDGEFKSVYETPTRHIPVGVKCCYIQVLMNLLILVKKERRILNHEKINWPRK